MATEQLTCVNHPETTTRLACSNCGAPICARCVRPSAVGQRCPECAKPAKGVRARGKPVHYARAVGAGSAFALVGGLVVSMIGFGSLILSGVVGFGVGRVVVWGTRGQTQPPFPAVSVSVAVGGLLVAFLLTYGTPVPGGLQVLSYPLAGWFAHRGLYR